MVIAACWSRFKLLAGVSMPNSTTCGSMNNAILHNNYDYLESGICNVVVYFFLAILSQGTCKK